MILSVVLLTGCDLAAPGLLPSLDDLQSEFAVPAFGTSIVRVNGGDTESGTARLIELSNSTMVAVGVGDGGLAISTRNVPFDSIRSGAEYVVQIEDGGVRLDSGQGDGVLFVTEVGPDHVAGYFAGDASPLFSPFPTSNRYIGAFHALRDSTTGDVEGARTASSDR